MKKILETERLILREFTLEDDSFIFELLNTDEWKKYIGDRGIKNLHDAQTYISDKLISSYIKNGFGFYMVELKNENIPIGMCGLAKREALDHVDVGYALLPAYFKKGYAFEAASATVEYAKNNLGLKRILAITIEAHADSIKLLGKLNFKFEKKMFMPDDPEELMIFGINFVE